MAGRVLQFLKQEKKSQKSAEHHLNSPSNYYSPLNINRLQFPKSDEISEEYKHIFTAGILMGGDTL